MNQDTTAFLTALGGIDTPYNFRAIHDTDHARPALPFYGTLAQCEAELTRLNAAGYGIFVTINAMQGGNSAEHAVAIRAHMIDVDDDTPDWQRWRALQAWECPPTFYVASGGAGRFHAYWLVNLYAADAAKYSDIQRRLITRWQSDQSINDLPRVMRLPGTLHMKAGPPGAIVALHSGSGIRYNVGALEWALAATQPADVAVAEPLGSPDHAAPSLDWATYALGKIDPDNLDRAEWLKITAAFKTAAWASGEPIIHAIWLSWCARYASNDVGENEKLWKSIRSSKTGWKYLSRAGGVTAELAFGGVAQSVPQMPLAGPSVPSVSEPASVAAGPFLTPAEQLSYFAGCVYIERMGRILTPSGRFADSNKFNAQFGGKQFILNADGKSTDEPWKAATRGQIFQVPKVDNIRFLPVEVPGAIIVDELGRKSVNTYKPAIIKMVEGDAGPWIRHLRALVNTDHDATILTSYFAHVVQRPGVKAFWAPVVQSIEGAGKGIIGEALTYAVGSVYTYEPNASQLIESGAKFNTWMRSKLLIIANEIRVDDKRDLLDALKPMISERRLEVQGKGADQDMEDNPANWTFFTNFQDAVPVTEGSRRYAIFFSPLQTLDDINRAGMGERSGYFPKLVHWLRTGGLPIVAHYLKHYPIPAALDPAGEAHRAPRTSSTDEAIQISYGPIETALLSAIEGQEVGFRNGWISSVMASKLLDALKVRHNSSRLKEAYRNLGYKPMGRSSRQIFQEDRRQPYLYNRDVLANTLKYPSEQGYE